MPGSGVPGTSVAEYGIAFFCVAGMIYLATQVINFKFKKRENGDLVKTITMVTEVVENNTMAMKQLENMIEVNMVRQEAKLDELVAYVRRKS